jgi:pimeloyl-ACP methyl ester carboxylesterase
MDKVREGRMTEVSTHTADLDGQPVFWRTAPGDEPPVLYVHGVPTSSDIWLPFLERTGGIAPDLQGFGRSGKRGDLDYTIAGFDRWLERFLAFVGVDRIRLVVQDWGVVALAFAQRFPERVERVVVIDGVPLLPGYRWHPIARIWRTRGLGELLMGSINRATLRLIGRTARVATGSELDQLVQWIAPHFDQGTQRAILRFYRSSPPEALARAGERLGELACPALVVWGDLDPFCPARFADQYAAALGGADVLHLPDASHWPWLQRPDVVERVAEFLSG